MVKKLGNLLGVAVLSGGLALLMTSSGCSSDSNSTGAAGAATRKTSGYSAAVWMLSYWTLMGPC